MVVIGLAGDSERWRDRAERLPRFTRGGDVNSDVMGLIELARYERQKPPMDIEWKKACSPGS